MADLTLESVGVLLDRQEREVQRRVGEAQALAREGKAVQAEIARLDSAIVAHEEAIGILTKFADARQEELQRTIETLVTHGLTTIFGEPMFFRVRTVTKGKLVSFEFSVVTQAGTEQVETPVMDARGGGVAAVVGFLLRLVLLLLKGEGRMFMALDETFAHLSTGLEPRLAEFVRELLDRVPQMQVLLVTHSDAWSDTADCVYKLRLEDGVTLIEEDA